MSNEIKRHENKDIALLSDKAVSEILDSVNSMEVISKEDSSFLQEHKEHLSKVLTSTHIWRTDAQKRSIISDGFCPTTHAKFHQALAEQKVQFDQSLYLAKEFELAKIRLKEKMLDLEELKDTPRDRLASERMQIEIQFMEYELQQMKTAMLYRMKEVKGWQVIEEELLKDMRDNGVSDEDIWSKDAGQEAAMFLQSLTNLQGIRSSTDGAERNNLIGLAFHAYKRVKESGRLDELKECCNQYQLESLVLLEGK